MGLCVFARDEEQPPPRDIKITVDCDGDHGRDLLAPRSFAQTFDVTRNESPRDAPTRAGWQFKPDGRVLCPSCRTTVDHRS